MILLTRNASARACKVTRQRPSGQQTCGRFTAAVLNYLHCQLAVSACLPFWIVRHQGPQLNSVSLSQLRRSLQLLITDVLEGQAEPCDDPVEAQLVGQALGQNVQRSKRRIDQGTDT